MTADAGVARTRGANTANKRRAAGRAALELARRLEYLDDERLAALERGLAVPDLRG